MPEIRRTALCDPTLTVMLHPAGHLPHFHAVFDGFLDYVERTHPEVSAALREAAGARFAEIVAAGGLDAPSDAYQALLPSLDRLQRDRLSYTLHLLEVRGDHTQDVEVTRIAAARARLYPMYEQMRCFRDLLGHEQAIVSIERYMEEWMAERTKTDLSLEDLGRFWDRLEGPIHETAEVAVRVHRGKIAARVEGCLWADVMRPLGDPELAHSFTCYGDFPQIRAINPNFVLTRTMTLMQGAPFCDSCSHDLRHVEAVEHPDRAFFESIGRV